MVLGAHRSPSEGNKQSRHHPYSDSPRTPPTSHKPTRRTHDSRNDEVDMEKALPAVRWSEKTLQGLLWWMRENLLSEKGEDEILHIAAKRGNTEVDTQNPWLESAAQYLNDLDADAGRRMARFTYVSVANQVRKWAKDKKPFFTLYDEQGPPASLPPDEYQKTIAGLQKKLADARRQEMAARQKLQEACNGHAM
uniref:Uncharacterized protein n=1 Tax=Hemiselmis andersenii TaxID=464988 RepID=A0A6U4WZZ6_HEMAN|mmetsp:Transcript_33790/g.82392  ORF Transcript_33790/g.82392 Transcript_33790/m.82392 type:complete len:194 (+) Transcript_33790:128-709(+)